MVATHRRPGETRGDVDQKSRLKKKEELNRLRDKERKKKRTHFDTDPRLTRFSSEWGVDAHSSRRRHRGRQWEGKERASESREFEQQKGGDSLKKVIKKPRGFARRARKNGPSERKRERLMRKRVKDEGGRIPAKGGGKTKDFIPKSRAGHLT